MNASMLFEFCTDFEILRKKSERFVDFSFDMRKCFR